MHINESTIELVFTCYFFTCKIFSQNYEHLIMYGQSLSVGNQTWPPLSTTAVPNNYMLGSQVWSNYGNKTTTALTPLVASLARDGYATAPKTVNGAMSCESLIVSVANYIQLKTGGLNNYIATSCGVGGVPIEYFPKDYWSKQGYNYFSSAITAASKITNNINCPALFWMQGESNYSNLPIALSSSNGMLYGGTATGNKAMYKYYLLKLENDIQSDIVTLYHQVDKPLMITYQTGKQFTRNKTLEIGMAQLEASNEYNDIICAGSVYYLPDRNGHLDPNGSRSYGEMMGKVYYQTKVQGKKFKPLQPLQISRMADHKVIRVKFLVPFMPLVFETNLVPKYTDYGFQIYLNGKKLG